MRARAANGARLRECPRLGPDQLSPRAAVLAENGRLGDTLQIADKFEELMMASRGEVKATVTSAEVRKCPTLEPRSRARPPAAGACRLAPPPRPHAAAPHAAGAAARLGAGAGRLRRQRLKTEPLLKLSLTRAAASAAADPGGACGGQGRD